MASEVVYKAMVDQAMAAVKADVKNYKALSLINAALISLFTGGVYENKL